MTLSEPREDSSKTTSDGCAPTPSRTAHHRADARISLRERRQRALAAEHELLAEREADWEDAAATVAAVSVLESLSESERSGLARVQTALERIERGTYDECAVCHGAIEGERLRAVPDTDRCGGCAAAH